MNPAAKLMSISLFEYDSTGDTFTSKTSIIEMEVTPFAEGGMRWAYNGYHYQDRKIVIIKRYKKDSRLFQTVANDVRMQLRCQHLAAQYNSNPVTTKKVEFVDAFLIQFAYGPFEGEYGVMEYYLDGEYTKHGSNWPAGIPFTNRNTPQAFSHFTFSFTNGQELVCDIQGVDDRYTDPQIHTADGLKYGQGNFGPVGIASFLVTHKCSDMCLALGLKPINPDIINQGPTLPTPL